MSQDYCFITIEGFDVINGVEVPYYLGESSVMGHRCHHYLDRTDIRGNEARQLTSPYGSLCYAIGTGDDFHCFDHARLPDGRVVLHSVINSETGSFIMTAGYDVVWPEDAVDVATGFTDQAIEWLYEGGDKPLRHHQRGWNQDEYYWVRQVAGHVGDPRVGKLADRRIVRDPRKRFSWDMQPVLPHNPEIIRLHNPEALMLRFGDYDSEPIGIRPNDKIFEVLLEYMTRFDWHIQPPGGTNANQDRSSRPDGRGGAEP